MRACLTCPAGSAANRVSPMPFTDSVMPLAFAPNDRVADIERMDAPVLRLEPREAGFLAGLHATEECLERLVQPVQWRALGFYRELAEAFIIAADHCQRLVLIILLNGFTGLPVALRPFLQRCIPQIRQLTEQHIEIPMLRSFQANRLDNRSEYALILLIANDKSKTIVTLPYNPLSIPPDCGRGRPALPVGAPRAGMA